MEPVLTALLRKIDSAIDDPDFAGEKKVGLREAKHEIRLARTELRDLDRPRPPIHARICRIMILIAEGGLLD